MTAISTFQGGAPLSFVADWVTATPFMLRILIVVVIAVIAFAACNKKRLVDPVVAAHTTPAPEC